MAAAQTFWSQKYAQLLPRQIDNRLWEAADISAAFFCATELTVVICSTEVIWDLGSCSEDTLRYTFRFLNPNAQQYFAQHLLPTLIQLQTLTLIVKDDCGDWLLPQSVHTLCLTIAGDAPLFRTLTANFWPRLQHLTLTLPDAPLYPSEAFIRCEALQTLLSRICMWQHRNIVSCLKP